MQTNAEDTTFQKSFHYAKNCKIANFQDFGCCKKCKLCNLQTPLPPGMDQAEPDRSRGSQNEVGCQVSPPPTILRSLMAYSTTTLQRTMRRGSGGTDIGQGNQKGTEAGDEERPAGDDVARGPGEGGVQSPEFPRSIGSRMKPPKKKTIIQKNKQCKPLPAAASEIFQNTKNLKSGREKS